MFQAALFATITRIGTLWRTAVSISIVLKPNEPSPTTAITSWLEYASFAAIA